MLPPIPDPQTPVIQHEKGLRPPKLKAFMVCNIISTVVGVIYCDGTMTEMSVAADFAFYVAFSGFWWLILSCLWCGQNWARVVAMIGCALSFSGLPMLGDYQGDLAVFQQIFTVINSIMGAYFFWQLRSPAIVEFCKGEPV